MPSVAGPAGKRRAFTEELDVDATAVEVAVAQQAHHLVALERSQHGLAGVGTEGDHGHAELAAQLDEPVEQLGRVELLDDDGDLDAAKREPPPRPLPPTEVGKGKDDSFPPIEAFGDVLVPGDLETRLDDLLVEVGETKALDPIPRVRIERLLNGST